MMYLCMILCKIIKKLFVNFYLLIKIYVIYLFINIIIMIT